MELRAAPAGGRRHSGEVWFSERQASRIVGQHRGSQRYTTIVRADGDALTRAIVSLALVVSTGRRNTLSSGKRWRVAMDQRFRRGFTAAEKTELWYRWKRGESLKAIGRAFGKPSSSIYFQVAPHGGIRPALRRRSRLALTLSEREVISRAITAHQSAPSIATVLGPSPSTVSREISRNGGHDRYRAALADEKAWVRTRRPKRCNTSGENG